MRGRAAFAEGVGRVCSADINDRELYDRWVSVGEVGIPGEARVNQGVRALKGKLNS